MSWFTAQRNGTHSFWEQTDHVAMEAEKCGAATKVLSTAGVPNRPPCVTLL
jgi:hypothetical protein